MNIEDSLIIARFQCLLTGYMAAKRLTAPKHPEIGGLFPTHHQKCNWKVERAPPWSGFAYLAQAPESK